jgi:U3 small nucleolar RNA-associated protein 15
MFPNGGLALSAGGNTIKVWDLLKAGCPLYSFSNHQKTITSMCFDASYSRLISGSLDHHIKIYTLQDYKVVHGIKYPAPVLATAISPDDTHLVTGMSNGLLSIRQRVVKTEDMNKSREQKQRLHGGTYRYFIRGQSHIANPEDFRVTSAKKPKLRKYDQFLRKFQYKNALDAALLPVSPKIEASLFIFVMLIDILFPKNVRPTMTMSVIEELIHRDGLRIALSGRDEPLLEPIFVFVVKYITNPRFATTLLQVGEMILGKS